jgi:hypothetical protein
MRMVSSWKKDKRGKGVTTAFPVAAGIAVKADLSVLHSTMNKTRDQAWKIGDQAMKKAAREDAPANRGCLQ